MRNKITGQEANHNFAHRYSHQDFAINYNNARSEFERLAHPWLRMKRDIYSVKPVGTTRTMTTVTASCKVLSKPMKPTLAGRKLTSTNTRS